MTVKDEIQSILEEDGKVTASSVLQRAVYEDNPLHCRFEWDDSKAGHAHRMSQARHLIRTVHVEFNGSEERLVHVPFVRNPDDDSEDGDGREEGEYQPLSVVVNSEDMFDRALEQARSYLSYAARSVDELAVAANIPQARKLRLVQKVVARAIKTLSDVG